MEILNNGWIIGISTGLIAAIIWAILSRISRGKNTKELLQKIKNANSELMHSIRPILVDEQLPNPDLIDKLRDAISLRNEIESGRLLTNSQIINELSSEIMSNPFLSASQKIILTGSFNQLDAQEDSKPKPEFDIEYKLEFERFKKSKERKENIVFVILLLAASGVVVFATAFLYLFFDAKEENTIRDSSEYFLDGLMFVVKPLIVGVLGGVLIFLFERLSKIDRLKKQKK